MESLVYGAGGFRVLRLTSSQEIEALLTVFEDIAREQGWQTGDQLRAYQSRAVHFAVEVEGEIAGGLQLVLGDRDCPLPCFRVWPELEPEGDAESAEIALLALRREYRGASRLFWPLCVEVWRYCRHHSIPEFWAEVTPLNLRLYHRFGWPLAVRGPLRSHWGEACYPCCIGIDQIETAFQQAAENSPWRQELLAQAYREEGTAPLMETLLSRGRS